MSSESQAGVDPMSGALSYCRAGRFAEAEGIIQQVIQQQPNRPSGPYYMGVVTATLGRFEEARQWFTRALQLNPSAAAFYIGLAQVERALGKLQPSIQQWRYA